MNEFVPALAYVDPKALFYQETDEMIKRLKSYQVPIIQSRTVNLRGDTPYEIYQHAKKTVFITVNTQKELASCKPSSDYQFALSSSCPGMCEYCYLQTTQGKKPYIRIFANVSEILEMVKKQIDAHSPAITTFECASITDPVALDHLTGSLSRCITFFGENENGRLRFVTKFDHVSPYLTLEHKNHTQFRFSINANSVIDRFEHNTSRVHERIEAAYRIAKAGYPIGFIIAPIMLFDGWQEEYRALLESASAVFKDYREQITFELIQYRFTTRAKELIYERFPDTTLNMAEENRLLKWGPYGMFKYVYSKNESNEMKGFFASLVEKTFPHSSILYFT